MKTTLKASLEKSIDNRRAEGSLKRAVRRIVKCKHCKKLRGEHQANTMACPMGGKHRTVGWTFYSTTQTYSPNDPSSATGAENPKL